MLSIKSTAALKKMKGITIPGLLAEIIQATGIMELSASVYNLRVALHVCRLSHLKQHDIRR